MKVSDFISQLVQHNPNADITFSVEIAESFDADQRFFCEDGPGDIFGNAHPLLDQANETVVTVCLLAKSNL